MEQQLGVLSSKNLVKTMKIRTKLYPKEVYCRGGKTKDRSSVSPDVRARNRKNDPKVGVKHVGKFLLEYCSECINPN